MVLTREQEEMLAGKFGEAEKACMEILLAYGEATGAHRMIPISSAHIAGNYTVIMDEGIEWLEGLSAKGAKMKVFTTKNPELYEFGEEDRLEVPPFYRDRQQRIHAVMSSLGITTCYSCHHYLVGNLPRFGDHIAWASSGSQVLANSLIGARSNRDGDHVVLAAAITGFIPEWGLHLDENRAGEILVDVRKLKLERYDMADYKAMGWAVGKMIGSKTPVFIGFPPNLSMEAIKGLLYTVTVTGSVGLVHLVGITPEAQTVETAFRGKPRAKADLTVTQDMVDAAYNEISNATTEEIDLVIFGCPQCSIQEIAEIAELLRGRKVSAETEMWICTSKWVKLLCERTGLLDRLSECGVKVVADVGAADGPHIWLREKGVRTIAMNSARGCYYARNLMGMDTWFGSTRECVESAISGRWEGRRGWGRL